MRILVPLKPVVLVWGLLSAMILVGFIASSMLESHSSVQGTNLTHSSKASDSNANAGQKAKH